MYDLDGNDRISKEELLAVLTMMVGANISEEQLMSIAERTILEADENKDNLISFEEFCKVLERTDVEQKMSIRFLSWKENDASQIMQGSAKQLNIITFQKLHLKLKLWKNLWTQIYLCFFTLVQQ